MTFSEDGFLSEQSDFEAKRFRETVTEWSALARRLGRCVQALLTETVIRDVATLRDHRVLARLLLGRALSNFQACILLIERGLAVEARTLARSCLETTFCLTAVLKGEQQVVDRLLQDAAQHRRQLAGNLLDVRSAAQMEDSLAARLQSFRERLPDAPEPKWFKTHELAAMSPIQEMFVFYRHLSADAHPTLHSLERYFNDDDGQISFSWGPEFEAATVEETFYFACTFLLTAGVSFNADVAHSAAADNELGDIWKGIAGSMGVESADNT